MVDVKTAKDGTTTLRHKGLGSLDAACRALLALVALLALAGCQHVGRVGGMPVDSASAKRTSPSAPWTEPEHENLVTPEIAGKPVLSLRFGESVSVRKNGLTLTFTPKSLAKLDGDPPDLSDWTRPGENCHAWWKLSYEVVVEARPGAGWKSWVVDFRAFEVLQRSDQSPHAPVWDPGSGPDKLLTQVSAAEYEREQNLEEPFHKAIESKQYVGMCAVGSSGKPSGLEPIGVELNVAELHDGPLGSTTIAKWLL